MKKLNGKRMTLKLNLRFLFLASLLLLVGSTLSLKAAVYSIEPKEHIIDEKNRINDGVKKLLNYILLNFEKSDDIDVLVVVDDGLDERKTPLQYSEELFVRMSNRENWTDKGVLILLLTEPNKIVFKVSEDLSSILSESLLDEISEYIQPSLNNRLWDSGLYDGVDFLVQVVKNKSEQELDSASLKVDRENLRLIIICLLFGVFVALLNLFAIKLMLYQIKKKSQPII